MKGDEHELDEILAAFVDGELDCDRDELLARYPEHRAALESFFADYDRCARDVGSRRARSSGVSGWAGKPFGDYDIIEELARGAMGVVYRARQRSLDREVALKMVLSGPLATEGELERFHIEATAAASLSHPGIVSVHEVGESEGFHYLAMELIEGKTLHEHVADGGAGSREIAALLESVARAVHHAHARGVLHRDLKPGNVLVDRSGKPKVTDFSLARVTRLDSSLTLSGDFVGTPSYLAPEVIDGRARRGSVRGDVYGVGAVLYECLTGRPPFLGESALDTLVQVRDDEPVRPLLLHPRLSRDLENITLKALAKNPERRYESAEALANDLRRFVEGRSVEARRILSVVRLGKWCRRRPAVALLTGALALSLVVLIVGWVRYTSELGRALRETQRRVDENARLLHVSRMNLAVKAHDEGRFGKLEEILTAELPAAGDADHRAFEWHYLTRRLGARILAVEGEGHNIGAVALDPRGRYLATGEFGRVRIWDLESQERIATLGGLARYVADLRYSPDGRYLACATVHSGADLEDRGELIVWDLDERTEVVRFLDTVSNTTSQRRLAFSPDSAILAVVEGDETVRLWRLSDGKETGTLDGGLTNALAFSPDGEFLLTAGGTNENPGIVVREVHSGEKLGFLPTTEAPVILAFAPDGRRLLSGAASTLNLWNWPEQTLASGGPTSSRNYDGCFVPGSDLFVVFWPSRPERVLYLYRAPSQGAFELVGRQMFGSGHEHARCDISADGSVLAIGGRANALVLDVARLFEPMRVRSPAAGVRSLAYARGGRVLAAGFLDGAVELRDPDRGEPVAVLGRHLRGKVVDALEALASEPWVLSGSADHFVKVWDVENVLELASLGPHEGSIRTLDADGDEELLAVGSYRMVRIWDLGALRRGERQDVVSLAITEFEAHPDRVYGVAWHPAGETLITAGTEGAVRFWDATSWTLREELRLEGDAQLYRFALAPAGDRLAVGTGDGRLHIVSLAAGQPEGLPRTIPRTASTTVREIVFTPDGKRLIAATADRHLRFWETSTLGETGAFSLDWFDTLAVAPDGYRVATATIQHVDVWRGDNSHDRPEWISRRDRDPEVYRALERLGSSLAEPGPASWARVALPAFEERGATGVAVGDADADGDLDLFLTRNRDCLYLDNDGHGHFRRLQTPEVAAVGSFARPLWADLNGDGALEVLCAQAGRGIVVRRGLGAGFEGVSEIPDAEGFGLLDVDRDGRLDLFVSSSALGARVLRGGDAASFHSSPLVELPELRVSYSPSFADVDHDGDLEIVVTDSASGTILIEQRVGGEFVPGAEPLLPTSRGSRSGAWGDVDGDGRLDLCLTLDMGSDSLFRSTGNLRLERVASAALATRRRSNRALFGDIDLDGDLDLFLSENNGHSRLLRNHDGAFVDITHGALEKLGSATGAALEDFDLDGDLDLFVANFDGPSTLLRNDLPPGRHWLEIDLVGRSSNRMAVGAFVRLEAGGRVQVRQVVAEVGGPSTRLHFGLGDVAVVERLEIHWPSGGRQVLEKVAVDRLLGIEEE